MNSATFDVSRKRPFPAGPEPERTRNVCPKTSPLGESAGPVIVAAAASHLTQAPACRAGNSVVFIDPKVNDPLFRSCSRYSAGYYLGPSASSGHNNVLKVSEEDLKVGQGKRAADRVCNALRANQGPTLFVWTPSYTPFDENHRRNFMGMVKRFTALVEEQQPAPTEDRHTPPRPEIIHIHSKTFARGIRVASYGDAIIKDFRIHLLAHRSLKQLPRGEEVARQ